MLCKSLQLVIRHFCLFRHLFNVIAILPQNLSFLCFFSLFVLIKIVWIPCNNFSNFPLFFYFFPILKKSIINCPAFLNDDNVLAVERAYFNAVIIELLHCFKIHVFPNIRFRSRRYLAYTLTLFIFFTFPFLVFWLY